MQDARLEQRKRNLVAIAFMSTRKRLQRFVGTALYELRVGQVVDNAGRDDFHLAKQGLQQGDGGFGITAQQRTTRLPEAYARHFSQRSWCLVEARDSFLGTPFPE
ncbi:hypothetical protein GCM10007898_00630 [Dyella flagellata]|uniref:Uncharacterized protein n=1 Tax=Dyella flagellata TaxID=1867833 RepID=A0ABQ5X4F0_9GAMM|nr:hypothetical protein GCM10007898_00630 [Dyella flagellata]